MEKLVLKEDELQILREIQSETQRIIQELGEISLVKHQLQKRLDNANKELDSITQKEIEFSQRIHELYGKISLNAETGEFTKLD